MKLRIEIREGPPSMFNQEANLYVVATHPSFDNGEKMLGGPMTERNALGMVEAIRRGGLPKEVRDEVEGEEPELPPEPPKPKQPSDLIVPLIYVGAAVLFIVFVVLLGLPR